MRIIYYEDIKKGFRLESDAVIFKGRFFLLRNPTRPTEAATKDYLDRTFAELNSEAFGDEIILESQFPAFNGDIKNKKGVNYFLLAKVNVKGRYCMVETDEKGRVVSGKEKLEVDDLKSLPSSLPFSSLDFSTYKSQGHVNNTGLSYKDFTNKLSKKYLTVYETNKIDKPINMLQVIYDKNGVMNEIAIDNEWGNLIPPEIKDSKRNDYEFLIRDENNWGDGTTTPGVDDVYEYRFRAAGGKPWNLQYDISPDGKGLLTTVTQVNKTIPKTPTKYIGSFMIDKSNMQVVNIDNNPSTSFSLNAAGVINGTDITSKTESVLPKFKDTKTTRSEFVTVDRHVYMLVSEGDKARIKIAVPNGSKWATTWVNGPTLPIKDIRLYRLLVIGKKIYVLNMAGLKSFSMAINTDRTKLGSVVELKANEAPPANGIQTYGIACFLYQDYIFIFPGHQEAYIDDKLTLTPNPSTTKYLKAPFDATGILPKWEKIEVGFTFPEAIREPYIYHGKIYFATGRFQPMNRRFRKIDIEEFVNGLLVSKVNGDGNVLGVDQPKDIPPKDQKGKWEKNPANRESYTTNNPFYIQGYEVINPNYLPERWEPDPRNRPAYVDENGVEMPEVKYPDIHYPAVGTPKMTIPPVGPKTITYPAEIYPDVWIAEGNGKWIPNPNNKPGYWQPNPNYVPPTEKPNPDYKPGYWQPNPDNKPGYWTGNGANLDSNGVDAFNRVVDLSKLSSVGCGVFSTTPVQGSAVDIVNGEAVLGNELWQSEYRWDYKPAGTGRDQYMVNVRRKFLNNILSSDLGYQAPIKLANTLNTKPSGTTGNYKEERGYLFRLTNMGGRIAIMGGDVNCKAYNYIDNNGRPTGNWGDWAAVKTRWDSWTAYDPNDQGEWVPPVQKPDIWIPPVGEPTITTPGVGEKEIWIPPVTLPEVWVPDAEGEWVEHPDNRPAYCEPNPNYQPGYWMDDPNDPVSDPNNIYLDLTKLTQVKNTGVTYGPYQWVWGRKYNYWADGVWYDGVNGLGWASKTAGVGNASGTALDWVAGVVTWGALGTTRKLYETWIDDVHYLVELDNYGTPQVSVVRAYYAGPGPNWSMTINGYTNNAEFPCWIYPESQTFANVAIGEGPRDPEKIWVPPVGEPEVCYPEINNPPIWIPAVKPEVSDVEPKPTISVGASKDRLIVSSGYKIWTIGLNGGANDYEEYQKLDYLPVNK